MASPATLGSRSLDRSLGYEFETPTGAMKGVSPEPLEHTRFKVCPCLEDGNSLYAAFSQGLHFLIGQNSEVEDEASSYVGLRQRAVAWLRLNRHEDPFVENALYQSVNEGKRARGIHVQSDATPADGEIVDFLNRAASPAAPASFLETYALGKLYPKIMVVVDRWLSRIEARTMNPPELEHTVVVYPRLIQSKETIYLKYNVTLAWLTLRRPHPTRTCSLPGKISALIKRDPGHCSVRVVSGHGRAVTPQKESQCK